MNLWYTAVPIYEWEPAPTVPPADACADTATTDAQGAAADGAQPNLVLVFKGYEWIATPVWTQRQNPGWDLVMGNERDQDARRIEAKKQRQQPVDETDTGPIDSDAYPNDPIDDLDAPPAAPDEDRTHW
jgi:hypothetical protein